MVGAEAKVMGISYWKLDEQSTTFCDRTGLDWD